MINSSIQRLIMGKRESEAISILKSFKCNYRIIMRDGAVVETANDRDDSRYSLIISGRIIQSVIAG